MSINQLDKVLKDSLREKGLVNDGSKILLFVYDRHYIFKGFENDYASANLFGVGWLNGWDWHMQRSGKPNIRPIYEHEAGFIREKLGERGTFGYIYAISPSDVEVFRSSYHGVRIKLAAKAYMASSVWKPEHPVDIVTFWDPYDTVSHTEIVWNFEETEENMKWTEGIRTLQAIGCPGWYIHKVIDYIRGMDPVPTTVGEIFVKPEQRRVNESHWVGKSPIEDMLKRKPQEEVSKSNSIGSSASRRKPQEDVSKSNAIGSSATNLKVLNGVRGKDSRVTKAPTMNTTKRPGGPQPVNFSALEAAKTEAQKKKEVTGSNGAS